jgi:hypothetical protein
MLNGTHGDDTNIALGHSHHPCLSYLSKHNQYSNSNVYTQVGYSKILLHNQSLAKALEGNIHDTSSPKSVTATLLQPTIGSCLRK